MKKFTEQYKDIIITIPKKIKWEDYKEELDNVEDFSQIMNFKVRHFPKTKKGNKCYIVHNGKIKGWMVITGLSEKSFTCTTTCNKWDGKFIERSGPFNKIEEVPMKGFMGFRYYE